LIYIDTSVALAHLLAEDQRPPEWLWGKTLFSSRLLEYETWNRIYERGLAASHSELVRSLLARVAMVEMIGPVLERALEPFPERVRTLDALHLASAEFLRAQGVELSLASYDERQLSAARRLGIPILPL
jgi:predicted nucleic acid-binding protein